MANRNEVKAGEFVLDEEVKEETPAVEEAIKAEPVKEAPVTKGSVEAESNRDVKRKEVARKKVARSFHAQDQVPVSISPLYRPYFGNVMTVSLQGVSVCIPCNGQVYNVPKSFAEEVMIRINNQDELNLKKHKLSDVKNNFDHTSPGSLSLF